MTANPILLQKKYARVIDLYAQKYNVPRQEAMALFYHSKLCTLIHQGISDLHCMSDEYLAEELHEEWLKQAGQA